ncbi:MAG: glycosyltransferase, partial [Anaerolineae bacterium]
LLTVALLHPKKGIPHLLEALAILRAKRSDFLLDIVGDGPHRAEYEELARRLGLQDLVRFHGLKTKPEVAEFMRRADLFVLPSEWENLPCVIIEAMASGLPVVATSVGGIPEMVNDEVGRLVPPKDAGALAEAVTDVLACSGRYEAHRLAFYARERFSYKAVGRTLSEVYQTVQATAERSTRGA